MSGNKRLMTMIRRSFFCITFILVFSFCPCSFGENWARFRGPNGQGRSIEKNLPASFSKSDYLWVAKLKGMGHSSPVVWGGKVFITSASKDNSKGWLEAYDVATGKQLWEKEYGFAAMKMHSLNSAAGSTPALDDKCIYSVWYDNDKMQLIALDHDGGDVWSKDLGPTSMRFGPCTSPIVYKDMIIISQEQGATSKQPDGRWVALNKSNGDILWSIKHLPDNKSSYLVPCVYTDASGKDVIVFCSKQRGVCGVDPLTGKIVWQVEDAMLDRSVSSPVISGDMILNTGGSGGGGKHLSVVRPSSGSKVETVYTSRERFIPYVPTGIAVDGLFFLYHDNGQMTCLDSLTGQVKWSEKPAGKFYSSPVYADGKLYAMDMDGMLLVVRAGEKYEMLAQSDLGEGTYASVSMSNGRVFLRTFTQLICVGK
jgi:outer membrane protein assembly factor BamB